MTVRMTKMKSKPTHIYHEEVYDPTGYGNSTRQTFDKKQFDAWVKYARELREPVTGWKSRFYVGTIDWVEDVVDND